MKSENKYIGDDKFKKFLLHYACPAPLGVIKLRFVGAICSPNVELRPTDVIASLWTDNKTPRLETKNEADLFFKFFMGLWDEMFTLVQKNRVKLPSLPAEGDLSQACQERFEQLELGFVEGFFGGRENLKIPAYIGEVTDSLSRLALLYKTLAKNISTEQKRKNVFDAVMDCDKMAEKSIGFLIEHYVLPHMDELKRTIN
ncbi:MAG: hypothetical protein IJ218_00255 [Alphaproteobacteria bacterium]|nr:hypothetical protein [Alphaproteobacteria bacterium]